MLQREEEEGVSPRLPRTLLSQRLEVRPDAQHQEDELPPPTLPCARAAAVRKPLHQQEGGTEPPPSQAPRRLVELWLPPKGPGGMGELFEVLSDELPAYQAQSGSVLLIAAASIDKRYGWIKALDKAFEAGAITEKRHENAKAFILDGTVPGADDSAAFALQDIELTVETGSIVGIVGQVGSGKPPRFPSRGYNHPRRRRGSGGRGCCGQASRRCCT